MTSLGITTEWIELDVDGTLVRAYVARPTAAGAYPGVIAAHEIYGQHPTMRATADRLAALGAIVILPDLFHRAEPGADLAFTPEDRERGLALLRTLTRDGVRADFAAALAELTRRGATATHLIGFSAGGHAAYYAATQFPVASVTAFYPGWLTNTDIQLSTPEPTIELSSAITGRVLLFFGGADGLIDGPARDGIAKTLGDIGIEHEIVVYDEAPHAFLNPGRATYREEYAEDAWSRLAGQLAR
ncbi:dienelactone hydrolase family protein [Nocardia yamanashiensis]|uniref:dienelactone hydrolase family protein n=1 Tax=Nocardia yamanashiensis TaxID=209247 RepID=UPI000829F18B|nr:dienelactone hydrolase family protein [Nocardia yamanashiensis]